MSLQQELSMAIQLGDTAPDFIQESTEGRLRLHDYLGKSWGVLFSHPADFTPVCTTELGMAARLKREFDIRNVKIIGLSVDPVTAHRSWVKDINETQHTEVNFPIIADTDRKVSLLYDMIHPLADGTATVRSLFVICPDKIIKLMLTYPISTGRNFQEILRVIDALQLTANYAVATPANWVDGDDCFIVPDLVDEQELRKQFPRGFRQSRPYLRLTPQPNR